MGSNGWVSRAVVVFSSNDTSPTSFFVLFFCPTTFGPISNKRSLVKGTLTLNPIGQKDVDEVSLDELSSDEKSVHGRGHGFDDCYFV